MTFMKAAATWQVGHEEFAYFKHDLDFHGAQKMCHEYGYNLAHPSNAAENSAMEKHTNARVWIGLNDIKKEGKYEWVGLNKAPKWTHWNKGEPNDYKGKEDCTEMRNSGKWNDMPCKTKMGFVCQETIGKELEMKAVLTTGGTAPEGTECAFPFKYEGVTHTKCVEWKNQTHRMKL